MTKSYLIVSFKVTVVELHRIQMKSVGATYNQLIIFRTIAIEGSIRGAARKLEMAPPSVSRSLKLLESHLGIPLFNRTTRQMRPTEAGLFLLNNTLDVVEKMDYALEGVQELGQSPSGKVSITVPRFFYYWILEPLIPLFCERYPDIELELSVSDTSINIVKESIDIGIRFGNLIEEGVVAHQLTSEIPEAIFVSSSYEKKHGAIKSLNDLKKHKLVSYRFGASNKLTPMTFLQDGQTTSVEMTQAMIVNDTNIYIDFVRAGLGVGKLIIPQVEQYFNDGSLVPILQKHWSFYPGLYVYFSQNSQKAKRVRVLIDFLLENVKPQYLSN